MANRRSLVKILAVHTDGPYDPENREFIEEIASALYERHESFPRWPENVRWFYACYDINYQVGNGGFAQAADNVPELLPIAQEAFEHFGRQQAAELCKQALHLLSLEDADDGAKGIEPDQADLEASDKAWSELDENLPAEFWADDALQELVQKNREDFVRVDRIR